MQLSQLELKGKPMNHKTKFYDKTTEFDRRAILVHILILQNPQVNPLPLYVLVRKSLQYAWKNPEIHNN